MWRERGGRMEAETGPFTQPPAAKARQGGGLCGRAGSAGPTAEASRSATSLPAWGVGYSEWGTEGTEGAATGEGRSP